MTNIEESKPSGLCQGCPSTTSKPGDDDKFVRCPVGLSSRLITCAGPSGVTCSRPFSFDAASCSFFLRAAYVYRDHACLWLTAKTLQDVGHFESPGGMRALIESVHGEDADKRLPDALQGIYWEAEGRAGAERGVATGNLLDLAKGYVRDGGAWDSDSGTPPRIGDDPQVTLRLGVLREGRILPYAGNTGSDEPWRAWRLNEVNVSARKVGAEAVAPGLAGAFVLAKADGHQNINADKLLVVLQAPTKRDEPMIGAAMSAGADSHPISPCYGQRLGLHFRWASIR